MCLRSMRFIPCLPSAPSSPGTDSDLLEKQRISPVDTLIALDHVPTEPGFSFRESMLSLQKHNPSLLLDLGYHSDPQLVVGLVSSLISLFSFSMSK